MLPVPSKELTVEKALEQLQQALRLGTEELTGCNREIPDDLKKPDAQTMTLDPAERDAFERACSAVATDLHYEHLGDRGAGEAVWRFACEFAVHKRKGLVKRFATEYAKPLVETSCYFPVPLLTVAEQVDLPAARLIPGKEPSDGAKQGSVIAVPCCGTNYSEMAKRARSIAEHALRVLRASLRDVRFMPDEQLRFRLGHTQWFDTGAGGWTPPADQGWPLELDGQALSTARNAPIFELPVKGRNDVEARANLALKWFEQAQLAGDPLMQVLFGFTALEAILGDKSGGLKAVDLAIRRGLLALLTDDGMRHPTTTFTLYDQVRSAAVHGEDPPELSIAEAGHFIWDVRVALNQYLRLAKREGLVNRRQVRKLLDEHPRREKVIAGLLRTDPSTWARLLESPDG